ncbi:MAG: enoyl-CoA hydratase/isomerase family protein [Acidobacteriota bacterium]
MHTGSVEVTVDEGVASLEFHHPKKNSLPGHLLRGLALEVDRLGREDRARVLVLRSRGEGPFCAGASFSELASITNPQEGKAFFMGFARLILAMKRCPKFVIARVQGKAVGGGVGLVAAADYALALESAAVKLSELALGIGPFVVGPCLERKLGAAAFAALAIDTQWRDGAWARQHGLYDQTFRNLTELDAALKALVEKLSKGSPRAMAQLKSVFWEGTDHWEHLLEERAARSGRLVVTDFARDLIAAVAGGTRKRS